MKNVGFNCLFCNHPLTTDLDECPSGDNYIIDKDGLCSILIAFASVRCAFISTEVEYNLITGLWSQAHLLLLWHHDHASRTVWTGWRDVQGWWWGDSSRQQAKEDLAELLCLPTWVCLCVDPRSIGALSSQWRRELGRKANVPVASGDTTANTVTVNDLSLK